jgi:integrase/recombinase XerD
MTETILNPTQDLSAAPKAARKDLDGLKAAYLQHLRLKNLRPLSIRQMEQCLRFFIAFIQSKGIEDVAQVDADLFENYKAQLMNSQSHKGTPLRVNTVRERLFIAQRWFAFLKKKGVIFFDPIAVVEPPHESKTLPRGVLSPSEIQKLLKQPDLRNPIGYRDRTMMEVLYATGVRVGELVTLNVEDADLERRTLRVKHGKGGKERMVPLSTPCCRFLRRYLEEFRPELAQGLRPAGNNWKKKGQTGGNLIFLSIYGGAFNPNWVGTVMRRYLIQAGITRPRISPVHGFRHSVATHLLENGMDIRYVQVFLGHESLQSTQIYTHVERKTLKGLFKKCHPSALRGEAVQPYRGEDKEVKKGNAINR